MKEAIQVVHSETFPPEHTFTEEIEDFTEEAELLDPVLEKFKAAGYPLSYTFTRMFEETSEHRFHPETHQNNRKGSGFTQSTREIARLMKERRDHPKNLLRQIFDSDQITEKVFSAYLQEKIETGGLDGTKTVDSISAEFQSTFRFNNFVDKNKIRETADSVEGEGANIVATMIADLVDPITKENYPDGLFLPSYTGEKEIGTCTTAELFFLRARIHAKKDIYQGDQEKINVIVDTAGHPVIIEKIGLGESHSALALKEIVLEGVRIPPGGLLYVDYPSTLKKRVIPLQECTGFSFLRLTTLAVSPGKERIQAFGMQIDFQRRNEMPEYDTADMQSFSTLAEQILQKNTEAH